jgi:signal transduction histidine kinase
MPGWLTPFATLVPIGLLATVIRFTRARADAAARRAEALERERETATRAALAEERARIARELHDVVSHHVSVMVIQADAANAMVPTQPELAQQALTAIAASGREAMTELRHLLGLVAPLDDTLHPQPGLAELDALVDKVRAVGQPVTVTARVTGLPQGVDLTAYRVVQEGLTNAMRYAPGAVTQVELRREGDTLRVEVRNDAADRPATTGLGSGTGLLNLAERVRLYRGTIHSGLRPGGGFRLLARIPLTEPGALVP